MIHAPMFERLLLAEFAVVDLTLANPNVYYELGVGHAARPYTTVLLHANLGQLPFDLAPMRAVGCELAGGKLSDEATHALKEAERLVPLVSFAVARRGGATSSDS